MSARSAGVVNRLSPNRTTRFGVSRWSRVMASLCVGIAALAASAAPAAAQWRVGAFVGGEHESSWDQFLVVGLGARGSVGNHTFELNPRASYFIRDLMTRFQFDFNVLRPFAGSADTKLLPYVGTGLSVESVNYKDQDAPDQTNIGFNYIVGASLNTKRRVQPYAQFVYTVFGDSPNNAVVAVGLNIKLRKPN